MAEIGDSVPVTPTPKGLNPREIATAVIADKLGVWSEQRNRALAWVAEVITREANKTSHWKPTPSQPNYSLND